MGCKGKGEEVWVMGFCMGWVSRRFWVDQWGRGE